MATYEVEAGETWPALRSRDELILGDGDHAGRIFRDAKDIAIRAYNRGKASLAGSVANRGEPDCTVRVHDGCHGLRFEGLGCHGSKGRGFRITGSEEVALVDCSSWGHGIERLIAGHCPKMLLINFNAWGAKDDPKPTEAKFTPDKRHAVYLSGNMDGTYVYGGHWRDVTGSAFQMNGVSLKHMIRGVVAEKVLLENAGSSGTPMLSLIGVSECFFDLTMKGGNAGVTMFAEGDEDYACTENVFRLAMEKVGKWAVHEEDESGDNWWIGSKGFTPPRGASGSPPAWPKMPARLAAYLNGGTGTQPGTGTPPPPTDLAARLAAAEAELKALNSRLTLTAKERDELAAWKQRQIARAQAYAADVAAGSA